MKPTTDKALRNAENAVVEASKHAAPHSALEIAPAPAHDMQAEKHSINNRPECVETKEGRGGAPPFACIFSTPADDAAAALI